MYWRNTSLCYKYDVALITIHNMSSLRLQQTIRGETPGTTVLGRRVGPPNRCGTVGNLSAILIFEPSPNIHHTKAPIRANSRTHHATRPRPLHDRKPNANELPPPRDHRVGVDAPLSRPPEFGCSVHHPVCHPIYRRV